MTLHGTAAPPCGLRVSAWTAGGYTVAVLTGELDVACAPVLREQLLSVLRPRASRLVVDLSGVSFCDASGLAVLVGTARRARLLGGLLRLAAPAPAVTAVLRSSGLLSQFDIFPTVLAATAQPHTARHLPGTRVRVQASSPAAGGDPAAQAATSAAGASGPCDLGEAVTAVLAHADAWRDADPSRRFTGVLRGLARAQARGDQAALTTAARSLLAALGRYPLTYSPAVAATASDLRHLIATSSSSPALI
ncbi:MAG: STAS domain-containing protein [Micromonosporaceae bacterium]